MHGSATLRIPGPITQPREAVPADEVEEPACEAALTLASRAAIGGETLGADGKAAGVLTLLGLMFTVLARFGPEVAALLRGGSGPARLAAAALLLGFAGFAVCAVVQAFRTIAPRFRADRPSLAFFAEIARLRRDEYAERVASLSMSEALAQMLAHNHAAATICAEKYRQLARALRCFEAAAACWLALAVVLVIQSLHG